MFNIIIHVQLYNRNTIQQCLPIQIGVRIVNHTKNGRKGCQKRLCSDCEVGLYRLTKYDYKSKYIKKTLKWYFIFI